MLDNGPNPAAPSPAPPDRPDVEDRPRKRQRVLPAHLFGLTLTDKRLRDILPQPPGAPATVDNANAMDGYGVGGASTTAPPDTSRGAIQVLDTTPNVFGVFR